MISNIGKTGWSPKTIPFYPYYPHRLLSKTRPYRLPDCHMENHRFNKFSSPSRTSIQERVMAILWTIEQDNWSRILINVYKQIVSSFTNKVFYLNSRTPLPFEDYIASICLFVSSQYHSVGTLRNDQFIFIQRKGNSMSHYLFIEFCDYSISIY